MPEFFFFLIKLQASGPFLKIWKLTFDSDRPQLSDKKLFWKYLKNIQEHICIGLQVLLSKTGSVKLKIDSIHVTIEIRYHKTSKISSRAYIFQRPFLVVWYADAEGILGELIPWV